MAGATTNIFNYTAAYEDFESMGLRWSVYKNAFGAFNGLNFRIQRSLSRGMKPTFLIYQVTTACNSKCRMCGIWKTKPDNELSLKEVEDLLDRPFFDKVHWVNITGGEPFVRKDIVQIVKAMKERLPGLQLIAIPTNGFLTSKIIDTVKDMLEVLNKKVILNVNVSIDGIGEKHDYIRRTEGGYKKAIKTLDELYKLQLADDCFETGTETVIMDHNANNIRNIYEELKNHTPHVNLTPAILSPFYTTEQESAHMSNKTITKMLKFFGELRLKEPAYAYYHSKVSRILGEKGLMKRPFPCLGGYKTMYLDARGNVYPCLMLPIPKFLVGNIRDCPVEELWHGPTAKDIRKRLKGHLYCTRCTNNCDIMNNLKEEVWDFGMFMMKNKDVRKALMKDLNEGRMKKYV